MKKGRDDHGLTELHYRFQYSHLGQIPNSRRQEQHILGK